MLVAICDDEAFFREELKAMVFAYKAQRRLHVDVYQYAGGDALLSSGKAFDMVFLDYQMPGPDGMEVARELRRRSPTCCIVFITGYPQFVYESFEVQPFRFLEKPITGEQIDALMSAYIRQQKQLAPILVLVDGEQKALEPKDILYLEGDGKYCTIRTTQGTYHCSKTLAQVHALLPQHCFYRSHKSYVVNLHSISAFEPGIITLTNGEVAQLGRSKIGDFKRTYKQFIKDYYLKT